MDCAGRTGKNISVILRYDDISALTSQELEESVISTFAAHNPPLSVGNIPFSTCGNYRDPDAKRHASLSQSKITMLKTAAARCKIDFALHGYHHKTILANPAGGGHSEFKGLAYEEQFHRITSGREFLEAALGRQVLSFISPWNTYDLNTLRALEGAGFIVLSANRFRPRVEKRGGRSLQYLPVTIESNEISKAVKKSRAEREPSPAIVILLHPYDFIESGDKRGRITIEDLNRELDRLKSEPGIAMRSISGAVSAGNCGYKRFNANRPVPFENTFPPYLKRTYDEPIFRSVKTALRLKITKSLLAITSIGSLMGIGAVLGVVLSRVLEKKSV